MVRKIQIGKLRFRLEVECLRKKVAIDKSYCSIKKFLASTNKIGSSDSSHPRFFPSSPWYPLSFSKSSSKYPASTGQGLCTLNYYLCTGQENRIGRIGVYYDFCHSVLEGNGHGTKIFIVKLMWVDHPHLETISWCETFLLVSCFEPTSSHLVQKGGEGNYFSTSRPLCGSQWPLVG